MRNFTVYDMEQRSEAWLRLRAGRLTGSAAGDMLATIKSGEAAARRDLRLRLVCERLTLEPQEDGFVSEAMQKGIEREPLALAAYEGVTGQMVQRSGFLAHTEYLAGCSLDGHVGDFEGIVELKCPKAATHMRYLRSGTLPADHMPQILHNLWISGAQWCDFVSFHDRFPANVQLFRVRWHRVESDIADYEQKALAFLAEVEAEVLAVQAMDNIGAVLRAAVA